jgi:protein-tyrosine phosphatase
MGWFNRLIKKKESVPSFPDFSFLKTDIHSHLIPAIDDGAKSLDDAIQLIQNLQSLGYSKLITTPHVMNDYYRNNESIIQSGLKRLQEALELHRIQIELEAAAEYYLDDHFMELIEKDAILSFGDNYVLFELSFFQEPNMLDKAIFILQLAGYRPVLAHPERYNYWHRNSRRVFELQEKGVLLQVNLGSISGHYGPEVAKMAMTLSNRGIISFLGSDTHHQYHIHLIQDLIGNPLISQIEKENQLLNSTL